MGDMLTSPPTALFIIRGSHPVTVEVQGRFDESAAVGFRALVPWLVGDRQVTIDLSGCELVAAAAEAVVASAVQRIEAAGGVADVRGRAAMAAAACA
jgi:anti-anti-sigma regulatory factor